MARMMWKREDGDGKQQQEQNPDGEPPMGEYGYDGDYVSDNWWWSDTGTTARYIILCVLFTLLLGYFVGGYAHARRRLKKGLAPLPYHRWMVQRKVQYARPQQQHYTPYGPYSHDPYAEGYQMHGTGPPPPAYQRDGPPAYAPPEGASKVMADQHYHHPPPAPLSGEEGESSVPRR